MKKNVRTAGCKKIKSIDCLYKKNKTKTVLLLKRE